VGWAKWRMVSRLTRWAVNPWAKLTSATSSRVHTLLPWPNWRAEKSFPSGSIDSGTSGVSGLGLSLQAGQTLGVESMDGLPYALVTAVQFCGDLLGSLALVTGQEYLRAAQGESLGRV
jgi:hypothetical protein